MRRATSGMTLEQVLMVLHGLRKLVLQLVRARLWRSRSNAIVLAPHCALNGRIPGFRLWKVQSSDEIAQI